ncbi:MAG: RluA family pseudouridine synthase [candidate division WOR-3 bacterium]|nr:MAG: RluA family pseudouridine synthase [candidate division WOR-3 bacterium]
MSRETSKEFSRVVAERQKGRRIDQYLISAGIGISRNLTQKLIESGKVLVNRKPVKSSYRVRMGDEISVHFRVETAPQMKPESIPLDIIHEDRDIIVVNKSKGMVVHPARGNFEHTMVNALLHHCGQLPTLGDKVRPGVLHRLDKDTTGLIVFAKTDKALSMLSRAIERREVTKKYDVLCWNYPGLPEGVIEAPIGRSGLDRKKMIVTPLSSKIATTKFTVRERFRIATYLRVALITGRTHQIRVHFKHIGCPIIGDKDYGGRSPGVIRKSSGLPVFRSVLGLIDRQALHAVELDFLHPRTERRMHFEIPLPEDMRTVLSYLRDHSAR